MAHSDNYDEKYTKPDLRRKIKDEIMDSDKGGDPGQWSARKSQLLVQEYEKQGGGYKGDKDEDAKSLEEWTEQNWQTVEGGADARGEDGTKRYLPEAVWDELSDKEKREAERTKEAASKKGEQYVEWPDAVKKAYHKVTGGDASGRTKEELYERAQALDVEGRSKMSKDELEKAVDEAQAEKPENKTKEELYERAQELEIEGRSKMDKDELAEAVRNAS